MIQFTDLHDLADEAGLLGGVGDVAPAPLLGHRRWQTRVSHHQTVAGLLKIFICVSC